MSTDGEKYYFEGCYNVLQEHIVETRNFLYANILIIGIFLLILVLMIFFTCSFCMILKDKDGTGSTDKDKTGSTDKNKTGSTDSLATSIACQQSMDKN